MLEQPEERQCLWCETTHASKCDTQRWFEEYWARRAKALQFSRLPEGSQIYVFDDKGCGSPYQMDADGYVEIQGNKLQIVWMDGGWFVRCPDGGVAPIIKDRWLKPIAKDVVNPDNVSNPFLAVWLREHPDKSGNRYADNA
jgi:hypothetical protein